PLVLSCIGIILLLELEWSWIVAGICLWKGSAELSRPEGWKMRAYKEHKRRETSKGIVLVVLATGLGNVHGDWGVAGP
ncbi:hypothetical protein Nepgr_020524, partial [Nepenthes gracilis]